MACSAMHTNTCACILPLQFTLLNITITLRCCLVALPSIHCFLFFFTKRLIESTSPSAKSLLSITPLRYLHLPYFYQSESVLTCPSASLSLSFSLPHALSLSSLPCSCQIKPVRSIQIDKNRYFEVIPAKARLPFPQNPCGCNPL